jgi:hypothetical protein
LPTREEEHLNHEPLDNVNFEQLNEGINTYISQEEILFCIKKLKNNKASGEDHIINEYIKSTSGLFLPIYEKIFNLIFETGFLPDQNNFFFLLFKISKNENNVKILYVVEYDFLNPNWFSSNKTFFLRTPVVFHLK